MLCKSGFPSTLFNALLPPCFNAADLILPKSSLNVISTSASSPLYKYTSFRLGFEFEYGILTVGAAFVRATLETGVVSTDPSL